MKKQNTNKKKKDVDMFYIRKFNSELDDQVSLKTIVLKSNWKTDPSKSLKEQRNQDGLVFVLNPNDRKNSSYKMIKKLPQNEKFIDADGVEREKSHTAIGFIKAHHKENKKFKIDGMEKQKKKIKGILMTDEEQRKKVEGPVETREKGNDVREENDETRVVLKEKPWNHNIVGYIEVETGENQGRDEKHHYVTIVKPTWVFLWWLLLGMGITVLCLMMILFPYKAPEENIPGQINQSGQSWDGTLEDQGAIDQNIMSEQVLIPAFYHIELNANRTGVRLMNPNEDMYLRYVIYPVGDPNNILYDSDYIDTMCEVVWKAYDQLDGGEYDVVMMIYVADSETWADGNPSKQELKLVIDK